MDQSSMLSRRTRPILNFTAFLFIMLVLPFASHTIHSNASPASVQAAPTASPVIRLSPANVSVDPSRVNGTFSVSVILVNSPPINQWLAEVQYNYTVLKTAKIDYSNSVLGPDAQSLRNCIDGVPFQNCDSGSKGDQKGVIDVGLYILGDVIVNPPPTALLFKIDFSVSVSLPNLYSVLHLFGVELDNGALKYDLSNGLTTVDGYFNDTYCPGPSVSKVLCTPPSVDISVSPLSTSVGRRVTFNATTSSVTNYKATIRSYLWTWGDGNSIDGTDLSLPTHTFTLVCNCSVTLTLTDSYGIYWSKTVVVSVHVFFVDLAIGDISVSPAFNVYPGTPVQITAAVINNSTVPENGSLTINLEGKTIQGAPIKLFQLGAYKQVATLTVTLDTAGLTPRVYRIDAVVPPLSGENITRNNIKSAHIQLIDPLLRGSLSLSLAETTGLGIVVIAAVGFALIRLRKKQSVLNEPL